MSDLDKFKAGQKAVWSSFAPLETITAQAAPYLIRFAGIKAGQRVLDVACGTGVVALGAAREGATVTGVDLTPELIAAAKENAKLAKFVIDFQEGDVEKLPFPDESFDVVVSQFGHIFAPRPEVATKEMLRVLKKGGTIAFNTWSKGMYVDRMFGLMSKYGPPSTPGVSSPINWGEQAFVKEQLGDAVTALTFSRGQIRAPALSPQHMVQLVLSIGPTKRLAESLPPEKLAALSADLGELISVYFHDYAVDQSFDISRAIKK